MREILRMIVVLAIITGVSGLLLAFVNQGTQEQRKAQILKYVKGPAIHDVLSGSENEPLDDLLELKAGAGEEILTDIFPAYKEGKLWAVAFESSGKGFGGDIGVIVGIDVTSDSLVGIGITTHKETPGLGSRVEESGFRIGFKGVSLGQPVKVQADGGGVDAVSGATISSRGVCEAVTQAAGFYQQNKEKILAGLKND